jgi:two-component system sensor histidine kinase CreC
VAKGIDGAAAAVAIAGVVLVLFATFLASRLVRARRAGMSIRLQLFLALAVLVSAFSLGLGLLVLNRIDARARLLAEDAAHEETLVLATIVENELAQGRSLDEVAELVTTARSAEPGTTTLTLIDAAGAPLPHGAKGAEPGENTLSVSRELRVSGRVVGQVRVVKPTLKLGRTLLDFTPAALITGVVLILLAAGSAAWIGRTIATPIEALTEFAVRVSEGERRAPPPPALGREVQRLSRAIDSMRRELEGRPFVETFAADLSHELKNPVAAIRASAEVLADGALDEPEEAARFVARIREATARIEALLGDLLSLARIEARGVEEAGVVDLSELVRQVGSRATERGSRVTLAIPGEASVRGDKLWLGRAIENLVDNALVHGATEEPVSLELSRAGGRIVVTVRNRGSIGKHVSSRLFKRFVTTRADRGGTGLGLAIVRAIAEAHSGSAECTSSGPPEVEFRITLPEA